MLPHFYGNFFIKAEVFMCTKCGKQIVGKKRFQSHVNNHPTNFKMVTCEVCEQVNFLN